MAHFYKTVEQVHRQKTPIKLGTEVPMLILVFILFFINNTSPTSEAISNRFDFYDYYELDEDMIPTIYIPVANQTTRVAAEGVHLVMEVVVQAIPTTKPDGTAFATCWEAWSYAVGKEIKAK